MPKVSVIVPIYNVEKYLRQCLDSIANQTLKDIEIICVNDGSKDGSLAIIQEYAAKDSRFVVIDKPNAGYGHSMNVGLDAATGEYMGIVDSDDYILPEMYETLYEYAVRDDLDMVRGGYYKFYVVDGEERATYWQSIGAKFRNTVYCPRTAKDSWMSAVVTPSGIYKIDFLRKNKIRYNETPGAALQDHGFWFKTHVLADRVLFIDPAFYMYRFDNPNSSIYTKSVVDTLSKEYDFIKVFVDEHPELSYFAVPFYWKSRFMNCYTAYGRSPRTINMDTIGPLRDPFLEAKESGELDVALFNSDQLKNLNQILKKPEKFCERYRKEVAASLYQEHVARDLNGKKPGMRYRIKWHVKQFGLGFGIPYAFRQIKKRLQKKKEERKAARLAKMRNFFAAINPEYERQKKLNTQMASFLAAQANQNYRRDQMFWWSINQPGELLSDTKKRFFLNMPKAEGKLRERQEEYIAVLSALKKLLDDNGIPFWPMGGTMIGMLRHKGFVPWDDDVDISMMYEDKEKLFELVENSQDLKIEMVYWCDPASVLRCPRVSFKDPDRTGLVDIFFWERANDEPTGFVPLWNKRNQCVAEMNKQYVKKVKPKLKKAYRDEAITDPNDKKRLEDLFDKYRQKCLEDIGTGGTTIYGCIDDWFQRGKWRGVYAEEDVFPMRDAEFEGEIYKVPANAEQFLTDQYGDWMAIPGKITPNHGG